MLGVADTAFPLSERQPVPFVGTGALADALANAVRGAAIVVGEPGAGKTRLLAEAARRRRARGVETLTVVCLPAASHVPFDPLLMLMKSLAARGRLAPRALRMVLASDDAHRLHLLYDALERAASTAPLALVLDDLHHADAQTLQAVHYCVDRLRDAPLVWNLAQRPGCAASDELGGLLARAQLAAVVELDGLAPDDVATLARALAPGLAADTVDMARLHERTGGNPLYVELATREPHGDGALRRALAERLRALPPDALAVAGAIAAHDGMWAYDAGQPLAHLTPARAAAALATLVEQRIVRRSGDGYRFRHGVVRDACAEAANSTVVALGEAAVSRWEGADDDPAAIARLENAEAGARDGARSAHARILCALGAAYESAGRIERAREALELALARCDPATDLALATRLRARHASVEGRLGDPRKGIAMLEPATELAAAHGLTGEVASCCAVLCALCETVDDLGRFERWCRFGLDVARSATPAQRAPLLRGLAQLAVARGRLREALALAGSAVTATERAAAPNDSDAAHERGEALALQARIAAMLGDFTAAAALLEETRTAGVAARARPAITFAAAIVCELRGEANDALTAFAEAAGEGRGDARRTAHELAALAGTARCANALGLRAHALGAAEQLRAASRFGWTIARRYLHEADGMLALLDGDIARGCEELLRASELGEDPFRQAALLLRVADARKDRRLFLRVIESYDAMEAVHAAGVARAAARAHGLRPGRMREPRSALSAREGSVAMLVAAGMTNNEIGELLHITARTVEYHVGNILTKCGLRSRVEVATRFAAGQLRGRANDDAPA